MNRKSIYYLLVTLLLVLANKVGAQSESMSIQNFSVKEGLTSSGVNSVYKDSKGFLWICANNGLYRYDGYSFKNINVIAKGYLKFETYCILEDKNQNFWIGTAGSGLFFYNSHSGELLNVKLSEGNQTKVNALAIFHKKLFMATNKGLLVMNEQNITNETVPIKVDVLWPDPHQKNQQMNVINCFYQEKNSSVLWVGTNANLYLLDVPQMKFTLLDSKGQNSIRCISLLEKNTLMVSSWDGGVFAVNTVTKQLVENPFVTKINKVIRDKRVKVALMDQKSRCWVATFGEGLYVFDPGNGDPLHYTNFRNNESTPLRLKTNFLDQLFLDEFGSVWISSVQAGLSKIYMKDKNLDAQSFPDPTQSDINKEILTIRPSSEKDKFWIVFNRNEIDLYDTQKQTFQQFTMNSSSLKLQKDKVLNVYQDHKGNLWIVYSRIGLYVIPSHAATDLVSGRNKTPIVPLDANQLLSVDPRENSYITCFFSDSQNRLWIGSWGATHVLEFKKGFAEAKSSQEVIANIEMSTVYEEIHKESYEFSISPVNDILELEQGKYWIGTRDAGIIEVKEKQSNFYEGSGLKINEQLPNNNICSFLLDKNKNIWIGTLSGLCFYSNGNLKVFDTKNGLTSESIYNLVFDNNQFIWASTAYGIVKINPQTFAFSTFQNQENEKYNQFVPNSMAVNCGKKIWFATNEALISFYPDSLHTVKYSVPLYFTDIKINNKSVIPGEKYRGTTILEKDLNDNKSIDIPYGANLHIEFAALNLKNPEDILYKYKIGKNNEWITLSPGQRSLNLPNINHGEYNLVIALANPGIEARERTIKINFLPPFWLSGVAYFIYLCIVVLILIFYRRQTIQKITQKSVIEQERYERKKVEELDKMKTEFFSNISHEFRTPLSLIINPLERLVTDKEIGDKNKERLKLALKSSHRLLRLTNELMDFSKLEKELLKPDYQPCDVVGLTNDICQLFQNLADSSNVEFRINSSIDFLSIPIDKGMIEKAIFNLLSNAFKFTSLNGVIMVNITKTTDYVKISVINTGKGISKENISKVFDRYYQVNNVEEKKTEGTGIGLALVKSFVELHHGKAEVKSDPGLETCFDIYLPLTQENFTSTTQPSISVKEGVKLTGNNEPIIGGKIRKPAFNYRVLVIEDEDDIRNYIIEELSPDYKILSGRNGAEGMAIANETIPDIIITDVMMPVLSGIELCKNLKNQVITSHIPIIILSAKTAISHQIEGLEMGADVYIIKPFNIDFLKAQISRLISFKQAVYSRYLKENILIPADTVNNKLDEDFMKKITRYIDENITNTDLSVDQLASCVALSKVQTYRKVKAISGLSIVEFIRTVRLKKASQLIIEGHLNFSEIAFDTGFSTPSYFSKCFHDHFGKTPSEFANDYGKINQVE